MIICVGLGNPGKEYQQTRHNIGFRVVEAVAAQVVGQGVNRGMVQPIAQGAVQQLAPIPQVFIEQKKLFARVARLPLTPQQQVLCVQPLTFMNDSGKAVAAVLKYHSASSKNGSETSSLFNSLLKKDLPQLYVCHDDLDLQLGSYKIHWGKGPKVHNGLASLYEHLGTKEFWHVRIGVDSRGGVRTISGRDYVLQPFVGEEEKVMNEVVNAVATELVQRFTSDSCT